MEHEEGLLTETERLNNGIWSIKQRMLALDYDIQACEDGQEKAKTIAEYRAERRELRNQLRELQGKTPLEEII